MATRLYYVANTAPPVSPAFDAGWNSTTGAVRRMAATTQAAATEQSTVNIGATGPSYTCQVQLVSPPLTAQTITGSVTVISRGREAPTANANVNKRARSVRVVSGDGTTVRGTLNAWAATTSTTELSATTLQGQQHSLSATLTSVTAQDGDRLVIEVGYGVGTSGTSPQGLMEWGGTGTDHGTGNSDVTGSVPWVEFSADIVFQSAGGSVAGVADAPLGFTAAASGTRAVPGTAAAPLGFAASAAGLREALGAAASPLALTATAAGVRQVPGAAAGPIGFAAAATGVGFAGAAEVFGIAAAPLGFGATAAGTRAVVGRLAVPLVLSAAVAGGREVVGQAVAPVGFSAAAVGSVSTPGAHVPRPDTGLVARPEAGVVARPDTGVVARTTGTVARPDVGVVARP